jgi:ATP/maltotriose-dependent transcriptional regulator MalT
MIEGEAGIGKTTLLWDAAREAEQQGFQVLSAPGAPSEVPYAYAVVGDLLRAVDTAVLADLPAAQRAALQNVLLDCGDDIGNERIVAAAFLSVLRHLTVAAPVLMCIDDAQWLDKSSQAVVGFVARRLPRRAGILVTVRTGERDFAHGLSWLTFARADSLVRIRVRPLSLGGVHSLVSLRLGRALPRPVITRIYEISGGNPLFAIELAEFAAENPANSVVDLPETLAALVRHRIGQPDEEVTAVLLAVACAAFATVERVSRVTDISPDRVVELVESTQAHGVVELDGNRIRFRHPLFSTGVYTDANPAQRRAMHRQFADVVDAPELKARHLALGATTGDPATLEALDAAAEATQAHGAPAVAAELTELAIKLGGDTPMRRIRAAEQHFRSGAVAQARTRLQSTIDELPPRSPLRCVALMLRAAVSYYDECLVTAVDVVAQAVGEFADDPVLQLQARLSLVWPTLLVGQPKEAVEHARAAVSQAERLGVPALCSQALSVWVLASFMAGLGIDRRALQTALEKEDPASDANAIFRASAVAAFISGCSGELDEARTRIAAVQRRVRESGTEIDILWAANQATLTDVWLGRYADAAATSEDALQRAEQMGGKYVLVTAQACQAAIAAYTGRVDEARSAAGFAIDAARAIDGDFLLVLPTMFLGFVEVSLGNYAAALTTLKPLLASFDATCSTELVVAGYLPDAVEALIALGRVAEAEPLIAALERNGAHHDRPWMLAVGARGRSQWLAARGELDAAEQAVQCAMEHHQRLPMPFEKARSQLVLGQLQRRRRRRQVAEATLREALDTFDRLGAPLWVRRAHAELGRLMAPVEGLGLTAAEQRVAERAAAGLSNKQIAAELFISSKTVEMNLSSVYRKLGIRSRAGLFTALYPGES